MRFMPASKLLFKKIMHIKSYTLDGNGKFVVGSNVWFNGDNRLVVKGTLQIGNNVFIGHHTCISAYKSVTIGNDTQIASHCFIIDGNHGFDRDSLIRKQIGEYKSVSIGSDCWLGVGVKVLPGVSIGNGAVVGAGSVVVKDLPPYSISVGVPATAIKFRS